MTVCAAASPSIRCFLFAGAWLAGGLLAQQRAAPSPSVVEVITQASRWLMAEQQQDGRWRAMRDGDLWKFSEYDDVSVTALSILALLPGASTEGPDLRRSVRRATAWLDGLQGEDGSFGAFREPSSVYAHALALRALCSAQRAWPSEAQRACIEDAVRYALKIQNPVQMEVLIIDGERRVTRNGSGWGYEPRMGDNYSHLTAEMLRALAAGRAAKCEVPQAAQRSALELLRANTNTASGRTGFSTTGGPMSRVTPKQEAYPGVLSEQPTAMRWLARVALRELVETDGDLALDLVAALPPKWDREAGSIDFAYWMAGAEVMSVVRRRSMSPSVERWRSALHEALIPNRVVEGDRAHWPAVDAWSVPGMECYSTATALVALHALR